MNRKIIVVVLLVVAVACNNSSDKKTLEKISLRQEWFPYSGYAGEMVAMYETDSLYGLDLKVEEGSDNIDPIKLVISGQNDFGVASSDRVLTANEQGANLVVIGVVNYLSPTCFIAKEGLNIRTPKDFENKTVGILTGTNTEYVYKTLVSVDSLNVSKIKEVEIPFDLNTFISGVYDVRPAFIYDEPVSLDLQNIKYTIIKPSDYGVNFIGTVYFTRKEVVEKKPLLVQAFINTIAAGWELALKNPEKSIKYLKQFDRNIDENRELLSLKKGAEYFTGENNKILYASKDRWERMAEHLRKLGVIKNFEYSNTVNNSFVENNINKK